MRTVQQHYQDKHNMIALWKLITSQKLKKYTLSSQLGKESFFL